MDTTITVIRWAASSQFIQLCGQYALEIWRVLMSQEGSGVLDTEAWPVILVGIRGVPLSSSNQAIL